jgi:signal transduction histidine kinase/ligand-binding sensor domain-containing protein
MLFRLIAFLSILLLASGGIELAAEDTSAEWFYRAWQTEQGLPDNSIAAITQSPDGYLWLGTNGGAIRFNGRRFHLLPLRDIPELPSRQVHAMHLDPSGNLWLGIERGPLIRVGENSYQTFHRGSDLFKERTLDITDDRNGRVWVAYPSGVCRIEGDVITSFEMPLGPTRVREAGLICDAEGRIWLAHGGKLGRLHDGSFELVRDFEGALLTISPAHGSGIWVTVNSDLHLLSPDGGLSRVAGLPEGVRVNAIFQDHEGAVWIGTRRAGLLRVEDGSVERVATSHVWVGCITGDREGNIWAGTKGGGLNLIRPRAVEFIEADAGLPFSSVRSTACAPSGRLWAVSQDGQLAYRESRQWHLHPTPEGADASLCVAVDSEDRVWVGTRNQGLLKIDGDDLRWFGRRDGLTSMLVRSVLTAGNGDVWIATDEPYRLHLLRDGRISRIEHTGSLKAIRAMAEGADGTIWIGTSEGRLLRVDGGTLVDESALDGPLLLSIRTLHATPDGSLWIGYAGDGLGHLINGQYTRITTGMGLHDDYISQIQDDGTGSLWIAANRGLFQVSLRELLALSSEPDASKSLRCRVFGSNDGVPSIQPSRDYAPAASRGPDDRLYFSTHSGIVEVTPDKIRENSLPPPVILENVSLDNRVVALYQTRAMLSAEAMASHANLGLPDPRLDLPPGHDKLVISVAALSLASPENVHLRYRLTPIDKDWEEVENRHSVTFPRLPAGEYLFHVVACNNVGVWNEEGATLRIVVHPFFWETWWFRLGGGLATAFAAGGLVFLSLRRRHRLQLQRIAAKQALEQERSRIARDIHDDLGASLTRITLLSQSSPPPGDDSTDTILDQIHATAQHLMRSMEEVVWAVNPEHDTFDALANYLSNYGQGFLGIAGVRCRLEMPMILPERPLSAQIRHNLFLAFKEALNNAVKHAGATEVRISMEMGTEAFVLKVEDNGGGIDPSSSVGPLRPTSGSGLANMKNRMDEIGGTCVLRSTLGHGTTVKFEVPFQISP